MVEMIGRLFPLGHYTDLITRRRAVATYIVAVLLIISAPLPALDTLLEGTPDAFAALPLNLAQIIIYAGAGIAAVQLNRRKQQPLAALLIVGVWFAQFFVVALAGQVSILSGFVGVLVGISLGTLLMGENALTYMAVVGGIYLFMSVLVISGPDAKQADATEVLLIGLTLLITHIVVNYALARGFRTIARQIAADLETRSLRLAGASGALAQRLLAARLDLRTLLDETVRLVRDTFPSVDVAQIFLVDKEKKNATLVATTGQTALGQQVGVGSLNVIGRVTIGGQSVVVRDSGDEQAYRRTAFLEGTHAELVMPLRVGMDTIGALDLQSKDGSAFKIEDVEAIETLANQIAVAIDNARLFEEAQIKMVENQRLYEQASASLREIERLNQQLTGGAWAEYLRGTSVAPAYTIDPMTGRIEDAAEWTSTLAETSKRNQTVIRSGTQVKTVALPISVRGEVIGAMEFELAPDQAIGQEQMAILQQVVERLGLAAENMRLLDEAQRIAQREAMVNEITARMQAATNVEAVVAAATQSLADSFQAKRVAIRLGTPNQAP
jgi:GAF domain-containing protein